MDFEARMNLLRVNGPRRPTLRFVLKTLAVFDRSGSDMVFGGTLEDETGFNERTIREALRDLVLMGWLEPEKGPSSTLPPSRNQFGPVARPRVHAHLGGRRPADEHGISHGCKTRYRIIYRDHPADEAPRKGKRKAKGEPGTPIEGGTGLHNTGGDTPPVDPARGKRAPSRGNGAPSKGEPASPERKGEIIDRDAGGVPPLSPPKGGEPEAMMMASEPPQAAGAAVSPDPEGPVAIQGTPQGIPQPSEAQRHLEGMWAPILRQMAQNSQDATGIRLWLITPKVHPRVEGEALHIECPSWTWARHVERYADQLRAAVAQVVPVSTITVHPKEAA